MGVANGLSPVLPARVSSSRPRANATVTWGGVRGVIRLRWAELRARLEGGEAPTDDDVSITKDGWRLDSKEAVREFLAEVEVDRLAEREAEDGAGQS